MKHIVNTAWAGKMKFDTEVNGHHIILDAAEDVGGENAGPRPKALMLSALAGCTGMDVISILKKMKVEPENFNIKIEADLTEEHPKVYSKVHIIYEFKGKDLEIEKLQKAIELSQEKYCGVSAMYRKAMDVSYEIVIN
jgi:putative redox protein